MIDATPAPTPVAAPPGEAIRFEYVPRPGLGKLVLVNFLLTVITLTIYRFWAKTNVRRHIWSCVHINGQPLEYTGRGVELFLGALIVFLVLGLPLVAAIAIISVVYGPEHPALGAIQGLAFLLVTLFWGAAIYRSRRYQLSRTLWRGIRGSLDGSAMTHSLLYFGKLLARGFTLGWATPVLNLSLQEHITSTMKFGSQPFRFKGPAGPLYPAYTLCWFLTIGGFIGAIMVIGAGIGAILGNDLAAVFGDLLGDQKEPTPEQAANIAGVIGAMVFVYLAFYLLFPVIWSIYSARELKTFASYTRFGEAQFMFQADAWSLIKLMAGNFFITVLTLGIGRAFVQQRTMRFYCDHLRVDGTVDVDAIRQSQSPIDRTGEGLADAFDIGGI